MEYAWSAENRDRWDPERTGVLWGRQHHTLDMELFGPNSWLTSIYLAALKAAARMADAVGEKTFAAECDALAAKGGAWVDAHLFNGRYYAQKLELSDRSALEPFDEGRKAGVLRESFMDAYWSEEYGQIKYQVGQGCLTDQLLGQWHADVSGLGDLLDPDKIAAALKATFRANFLPTLRDHFNPCRVYAYEDEGGLIVCSWPDGAEKPATPAPYAEEVWTGLEYMLASHLIMRGMVDEGLAIVRAARARHDGARRNPWNDIECGSYYARAMSAYALVNAYSGLSFDQRRGEIGFRPARGGDAVYFWSAGRGWGEIAFLGSEATLSVLGGELEIAAVLLPTLPGRARVDGRIVERDGDAILLGGRRIMKAGNRLIVGVEARGAA
jgi:non-lysosomal glucosylceramidase